MGIAQAATGVAVTAASKLFSVKTWALVNQPGRGPGETVDGQFPAENPTRNAGANWGQITALNRQNPVLQFISGELDTLSIPSRFYRQNSFDKSPTEKLDKLIEWTRIVEKDRRPPILRFSIGDGLALTANVVLNRISNIVYSTPDFNGAIREVTFTMEMTYQVPFDIDAEQVTDTRYARAKEGQTYEDLCEEEYGDPLLGVVIRQRNPQKAQLKEGDIIALPAVEGVRSEVPRAGSIALKTAFGDENTPQRFNRIDHFALRSGSKRSYIFNKPQSQGLAVVPSLPLVFDYDVANSVLDGPMTSAIGINDTSGNGHNLGLGNSVPYTANDPNFNNLPSLKAAQDNDHLRNDSVPIPAQWSLYVVARYRDLTGGLIEFNSAKTSTDYGLVRYTSNGLFSLSDNDGNPLSAGNPPDNALFVVCAVFTGGEGCYIRIEPHGSNPSESTGTLSPVGETSGVWIMTNRILTSKWEGEAGRFILYDGVDTMTARLTKIAQLKSIYGVVTT